MGGALLYSYAGAVSTGGGEGTHKLLQVGHSSALNKKQQRWFLPHLRMMLAHRRDLCLYLCRQTGRRIAPNLPSDLICCKCQGAVVPC